MSSPIYETSPAALRQHARTLDTVGQGVDQAVQAAETTLDTEAFGILCQFLPPFVARSQNQTRDAIQAVADEARSTASGLRRMAGNYDDNETTSGRRYTKAQTRLSRTPS
ncbi:MAG TPA: type VII secretion target [Lapillicoccus sp.]